MGVETCICTEICDLNYIVACSMANLAVILAMNQEATEECVAVDHIAVLYCR